MEDERTLSTGTQSTAAEAAPTAPYLFVLLAAHRPLYPPSRHCLADTWSVAIGRGDRSAERAGGQLRLRLPDPWMSAEHTTVTSSGGHWVLQDAGSRNGIRIDGARVDRVILRDGDVVEAGDTFLLFRQALPLAAAGPADAALDALPAAHPALATLSPAWAERCAGVPELLASRVAVVLAGESGTGKEIVARALHELSGRRGPFVAVDCGALPPTLVESELFGYQRGAFSGADSDRPGLLRSADRGTLFLDEIAELPPPLQTRLLRVLQESEVLPVGATRPIPLDLQVFSASQAPLDALVAKGAFRADLFARLHGFTLELLPLRERREDLGMLLAAFLRRHARQPDAVTISGSAARALLRHGWPLNIRELEKALQAALALAGTGPIELKHLPPAVRSRAKGTEKPAAAASARSARSTRGAAPARRKEELVALLTEHHGNVAAVGRALGKAPMQIRRWCSQLGLELDHFRERR